MLIDFTVEKKICTCQEDLLNLIEKEDVFNILCDENMEGFNELMKHELIAVKDDKVYLTPLGKEALDNGVKNVISQKNKLKTAPRLTTAISYKPLYSYLLGCLILLFLALLFVVYKSIWQ